MSGELGFIQLFSYLGLTPATGVPLTIFGIIAYLVFSKKLNKYLNPIKMAIVEIQTLCTTKGMVIRYSLTETSKSPLQPTEFGLKMLKESGMEEIVKCKKDFLFKKLQGKLNKDYTSYDVQETAIEIMVGMQETSMLNEVKDYAFKNGIDIEIILRLGGLILRDKFLKEHPKEQKSCKSESK